MKFSYWPEIIWVDISTKKATQVTNIAECGTHPYYLGFTWKRSIIPRTSNFKRLHLQLLSKNDLHLHEHWGTNLSNYLIHFWLLCDPLPDVIVQPWDIQVNIIQNLRLYEIKLKQSKNSVALHCLFFFSWLKYSLDAWINFVRVISKIAPRPPPSPNICN